MGDSNMEISEIRIKNYRRFLDSKIDFRENKLVILAGANNSGKTSLIQLLHVIFNNKKSICEKDISIQTRQKLFDELIKMLVEKKLSDEEFLKAVLLFMKNISAEEYAIDVKILVSYKEGESIALFSNYLMDLDENRKEFYFEFRSEFLFERFEKIFHLQHEYFYSMYVKMQNLSLNISSQIDESECNELKTELAKIGHQFENELFKLYGLSLSNKYYYTNVDFNILNHIEYKEFSKLFIFDFISADRELDDESIKTKKITNTIIESTDPLSEDSAWKSNFDKLFKTVKSGLQDSQVEEILQNSTSSALEKIRNNMDSVGETQVDAIEALMNFDDKILLKLVKDSVAINYVYQKDGSKIYLSEETQGLGMSNLIFISLELLKYQKKIKKVTVNFFVIEEPEAHMHVQMQRVLIDFLEDLFQNDNKIQGLISTHSNEIVKNCNLKSLKVIRPSNPFENKICDLKIFLDQHASEKTFYETFFRLNFSNLIFCDKAIIYEGDTERMFIEALISRNDEFNSLSKKYISYCQCGGAYAHKYYELMSELEITACVFTDIDYTKEQNNVINVMDDKSTNSTLNTFCPKKENQKILVKDIYNWQEDRNKKSCFDIFTQSISDGYARTLEEAILYRYICEEKVNILKKLSDEKKNLEIPEDFTVFTNLPLYFWKKLKEYSSLEIKIPSISREKKQLENEYRNDPKKFDIELENLKMMKDEMVLRSIRDIVASISNNKSDFMYSIMEHNNEFKVLPNYIKDGLLWLEQTCIS